MNIKEFIKGIIVGIAKIIPGLSGAVLMISFNLYDKAIKALTNFFDNPKKNFIFLLNLSLGIIIGIVIFSNILNYFITNYYVYTMSLFIGLIIGGMPIIIKSCHKTKKSLLIALVTFLIITIISIVGINNNYIIKNNFIDIIMFFTAGLLEAVGTILPGISSTALLMLIGMYNIFLSYLGNILNINTILENLRFMLPFTLGFIIGIIILSLLVNFLFKYHKKITFTIILGISSSSILTMIIKTISSINNLLILPLCILLILFGYIITNRLS